MRVLVAPDCFTGTLSAPQAAQAIAAGWARAAPHDELVQVPLSDGGPGFVDVLAASLGGEHVDVTVADPLGRPTPATFLLGPGRAGPTAYLESAAACGLHLLAADERDPGRTSSYGVGQLLAAALDRGADRVVVGLGGSGTNDAGAGLLAALGVGSPARLARGGMPLADATDADLDGLEGVMDRWRGVDLLAATDVDSPLLGPHGASAVFGPQKGATPEQVERLDAALARFADVVEVRHRSPRDLRTGRPLTRQRLPGAGAAGGLGYALLLLGGRRVSGVSAVLEAVGFEQSLTRADLVVTGEGSFDGQSLRGKVVCGVAAAAAAHAVPVVVVAGQVSLGRREIMAAGIHGAYAVAQRPGDLPAALADPVGTLAARAEQVARTWSPVR